MQPINSNSIFYSPQPPPSEIQDLSRYIFQELLTIQNQITQLSQGHVDVTHVAPAKPRDGDIRLADGINWNPGSGIGFYGYYNSAWHFLG